MNPELEAWTLEGAEALTGRPVTVICAASAEHRAYFRHVIFGAACTERRVGRARYDELADAQRLDVGHDSSLLIIEDERRSIEPLSRVPCFRIPCWVMSEVPLPCSEVVMRDRGVKSDLRRIRRAGLTATVTREPHALDDFYFNMYSPYVSSRHGERAAIASYQEVAAAFEVGELLLVKRGDVTVAGTLIVRDGPMPKLWLVGVRDADATLRDGVVPATNYFAFQHLAKQGCTRVNLGWSRPFLSDGVLQFKRKWGHRIVSASVRSYVFAVLRHTSAVHSFLHHNAFIEDTGRSLQAVAFARAQPTSAELDAMEREHLMPGLRRLVVKVVSCDDERATEPLSTPGHFKAES